MPKKKAQRRPAKRATGKPAAKAPRKAAVRRAAGAKAKAGGAKKVKAPTKRARKIALGRPKVTADEKLYLLFREDYHARQIFEFLRVETVGELEQYSPQQIVDRLSAPLVETVQRIRRCLADQNRALADDAPFAAAYKAQHGR